MHEGHAQLLLPGLLDERIYDYIDGTAPESLEWLRQRFRFLAEGAPRSLPETWLNWAIHDTATSHPVGTVQATIPQSGQPTSIAYVLVPGSWGRGHGRSAVELLLDELATQHGVRVVQAEIHEENERSIRLVEALDFVHEETVPEGDHVELIYRKHLRRRTEPPNART